MQEIMSSPIESITPTTSVAEAKSRMKRGGIHHLIVADGGQIQGVVSARDLTRTAGGTPVGDLMAARVVTATPRDTVREVANLMRGRGIGCLPIVERGRAVGIVTITDLLELIGKGATRPVGESTRWTLKARGPRRTRPSEDRRNLEYSR